MTLSLWPPEDETIEGSGRDLREGRITCVGLVDKFGMSIHVCHAKNVMVGPRR